ncbi:MULTISPECIES: molybdopterin-guanine dinucleotide biosynthesis protein B [Lactobacillus]|uniref:Molybdopterin-guanine dinucleotide biosynthesis protein B n=1 Tax=Lactobacillus xujianguonis TaxID=2495899 RepID=A0A437SVU0_9LACO|nr:MULTISPECIES: molybdopterin-guanine dinucleotide biosynthesis protein B [Lactobacillus]RVU70970.1 molybdopterin-guanine dinucleotide biosynthesis protein B [Lactobacillus xujianguonis]RVU73411.1 molybdopterin-guanine dinucleotide biosynthesis protein B [Lactobacillus xujianguonis]
MAITLQIIGHKKSGKTLITEALIKALTAKKIQVAAIKHDAHVGQMDVPGTDSERFFEAGAGSVILESQHGFFLHQRSVPTLQEEVERLKDYDVILIEGHHGENFPKVILLKEGETKANWSQSEAVIAFASLTANPAANICGQEEIVAKLINYLKEELRKC